MNNLKSWYTFNFSSDELGNEINPKATFEGLKKNLSKVYPYLCVYDSIIRERLFSELANRLNVDYSVIYNEWLNTSV